MLAQALKTRLIEHFRQSIRWCFDSAAECLSIFTLPHTIVGAMAIGLMLVLTNSPDARAQTPMARPGPKFELVDQHGRRITDADLRAKPNVIHFGFTRCPVICPTTLYELAGYMRELGPLVDDINFIFVTVDHSTIHRVSWRNTWRASIAESSASLAPQLRSQPWLPGSVLSLRKCHRQEMIIRWSIRSKPFYWKRDGATQAPCIWATVRTKRKSCKYFAL